VHPSGWAYLGVAEWSNHSVRQPGTKLAEIIQVQLSPYQFTVSTLYRHMILGKGDQINHFVSLSLGKKGTVLHDVLFQCVCVYLS
jgi:hypothetical protein